jgi:DNA-directed RNA polymerase subunit RPC12/RpoP
MPNKSFVSAQNYFVAMKKCPVCNSKVGVREYLYGMPMEEPDPRMFVVGGCCIEEDMPDYKCISCEIDFYKDSAKYQRASD